MRPPTLTVSEIVNRSLAVLAKNMEFARMGMANQMDAAFSEYPRWKYHPTKQARIVNTAQEDWELPPGWQNTPCGKEPTPQESIRIAAGLPTRLDVLYGWDTLPPALTTRIQGLGPERARIPELLPPPMPTTASMVKPCDNEPAVFSSLTLISDAQR